MNKLTLSLLLTLFACSSGNKNVEVQRYFSINGMIDSQVSLLSKKSARLEKTALINSTNDSKIIVMDSLDWKNELKIFKSMDLNKPVHLKTYEIFKGKSDPSSNLKSYEYRPIYPDDNSIKYLRISFVNDSSDIRRIQGEVFETNALFKNRKFLLMNFELDGYGNLLLTNFEIAGFQKMITLDSVEFKITGRILL